MNKLRVRAYNVLFGDAILVSVPDRGADGSTSLRHILIDVGNAASGEGGADVVFEPAIRNILEVLDGKPLDLYVMTHEHMDHVQGLLWAAEKKGLNISTRYAWLTASAAPDYYTRPGHEKAAKQRFDAGAVYARIATFYAAGETVPPLAQVMMLNNDSAKTGKCVEHLRKLTANPTYVYRGIDIQGRHPFEEAKFEILGPEEDTSIYYGRFQPMSLAVAETGGPHAKSEPHRLEPPCGVDTGAFYNLVERRQRGAWDNLLAIDKAANNTSVVFTIEWRGWRLLFAGDAEKRSWAEMDKRGVLEKPIHFLKVAHHGSSTGAPPDAILDRLLPAQPPDRRKRQALVSTREKAYNNVPDKFTLESIRSRCRLVSVGQDPTVPHVDVEFDG